MEEERKMDQPQTEVETTIDASPDKVWTAMTATKSPMYMGARMETDWKAGSKYTLKGEWNGNAFTDFGEIETSEPGKELSYTHWSKTPERPKSYNLVRMRLAGAGSGTKATLAQFGRGDSKPLDDKTKAEFKKTWTMMLGALKDAAEKG